MYCHNCGKQIADGSHFCPECGAEQVSAVKQGNSEQEDETQTKKELENNAGVSEEKTTQKPELEVRKVSRLSIAAVIMSLLGFFGFIGSILGIVDLCINRKSKHFFSILAIFLGLFITFVALPSSSPTAAVSKSNDVPKGVIAMSAQDFKTSCVPFDYDRFARNPDNFVGTNVVMHGQVAQVVTDEENNRYYKVFVIDDTGMETANMVFVYDKRGITERILEDDIVTIYATFIGSIPTTNKIQGTDGEGIQADAYYIDVNN